MKKLIFLILITLTAQFALAQNALINNFLVKENAVKNNKIAIIAADSLNIPNENINGAYTFRISGFSQTLNFKDGYATVNLPIEKSTFIYIKHTNDQSDHNKLVYVYKKDNNLNPIEINSLWLFLFPILLIILAFAFRKLIILIVSLMVLFVYFNHKSGLSFSTLLESIFDALKYLF